MYSHCEQSNIFLRCRRPCVESEKLHILVNFRNKLQAPPNLRRLRIAEKKTYLRVCTKRAPTLQQLISILQACVFDFLFVFEQWYEINLNKQSDR